LLDAKHLLAFVLGALVGAAAERCSYQREVPRSARLDEPTPRVKPPPRRRSRMHQELTPATRA